jgi:heme-degrading monooxygenase HmoA
MQRHSDAEDDGKLHDMVERVWSARATEQGAAAYAEYFRRVVLPEVSAVAGYRGARVLQRQRASSSVEIVVVTEWESLDVIRGFAGDDIERAVVHGEAAALLVGYDTTVRHYHIVVAATAESAGDR